MDGIWIVYLCLAAFPALILFAAIYKYMEVSQAARWPSAQGRVVISTSEARNVKSGAANEDDSEIRTFAKIVYEFTVAGRKYRGDRVTIGEDLGNFQVAETIAKYPVGKAVTVFYDPRKPTNAVLERDLPPGIWKGIIIVLVLVALIVGSIVGLGKLGNLMSGLVRNPAEAPFVTACIGFGLLAALVIWAIQRNAARQRGWPIAPGKVEKSGVHEFQERQERENGPDRWVTQYRAEIVYGYDVGGVHYTSDASAGSTRFSSNVESLARARADKFPAGTDLQVHYNPDNPAESVLKPGGRGLLALWLIPIAVWALAYFIAR